MFVCNLYKVSGSVVKGGVAVRVHYQFLCVCLVDSACCVYNGMVLVIVRNFVVLKCDVVLCGEEL